MPSSYTTRNRAEKQAAGENANTWGTRANENTFDMFDEALDGYEAIAVAANVTLTTSDGATDQARKRYLKFTGTGGFSITIPNVQKVYHVFISTNGTLTFTTGSGTTATVPSGRTAIVVCEGGNVVRNLSSIADGAGQWTQLASTAASGASSVTFTSISQAYSDLLVVIDGVSPTNADVMRFSHSDDNGSSFCTPFDFGASHVSSASLGYGAIFIPGYRQEAGVLTAGGNELTFTRSDLAFQRVWKASGGIDAVRVDSGDVGGNFDAGTIRLYAR